MTRFICCAALGLTFLTAGCNEKQAEATPPNAGETSKASANAPPAEKPTSVAAAPVAKVGEAAPDFELKDLDGKTVKLSDFKGKVVVLEWFNPGCPFVKASHSRGSLVDTAKKHEAKGVVWLAINSGAEGKQGFGSEVNKEAAERWGMKHPILTDSDGKVGQQYGATRTPEMFVIDKDGKLAYAGAIDNSPDGEGDSPTGGSLINYVNEALTDLESGKPVRTPKSEPYGCSVKYKS